jgi:hypothetical protein
VTLRMMTLRIRIGHRNTLVILAKYSMLSRR